MKDDDNGLWPQRQPGPLADLLGGRVEQYYALVDPVPIEGKWGAGQSKLWAELLSTNDKDAEVLMPTARAMAGSTANQQPSPAKSAKAGSPTSARGSMAPP